MRISLHFILNFALMCYRLGIIFISSESIERMGGVKIFYSETRQPQIAELSYADYVALQREADSLVECTERIDGAARVLSAWQADMTSDVFSVPAGVVGRPVFRFQAIRDVSELEGETYFVRPVLPDLLIDKSARVNVGDVLAVPHAVAAYISRQDPDGTLMGIFRRYYEGLSKQSDASLSVTFQGKHICLWNYHEWKMFAFMDIFNGTFRLSVPEEIPPKGWVSETWVPPKWMSDRRLARFCLDDFSIGVLKILMDAFNAT